jgi:hypothetical protein
VRGLKLSQFGLGVLFIYIDNHDPGRLPGGDGNVAVWLRLPPCRNPACVGCGISEAVRCRWPLAVRHAGENLHAAPSKS